MNQKERKKFKTHVDRHKQDKEENKSSAYEIYDKHLMPLIQGLRSNLEGDENGQLTDMDILDMIFVGRDISQTAAKRDFTLPGGLVRSQYHLDYAHAERGVRKGDKVWVRNDSFQYYVDIEHDDGRWFRLSKAQYREIEQHLRPAKLN